MGDNVTSDTVTRELEDDVTLANVTPPMSLDDAQELVATRTVRGNRPPCTREHIKQLDAQEHGASEAAICKAFGWTPGDVWYWQQQDMVFGIACKSCKRRRKEYNMSRRSDIMQRVTDEGDQRLAYRPEMLDKLREYVTDCPDNAMTRHGLACHLGVTGSTITRWQGLDVDGVTEEIVRGAGDTFAEFWLELRQFEDYLLREAFNQGSAGLMSHYAFKALAQHHGGYQDKSESNVNVTFVTVDARELVGDDRWSKLLPG